MPKYIKHRHVRKIPRRILNPFRLIRSMWSSFRRNGGFLCCGNLSYTLLLAFIPFAISMANLSALLPFSQDLINRVEWYVFNKFLPQNGDDLYLLFSESFKNSHKLSWISFFLLVISSYGMMLAISQSLNQVMRIKSKRSILFSLVLITWVFIIGSAFAFSLGWFCELIFPHILNQEVNKMVGSVASVIESAFSFFLIYQFLPYRRVKLRHSLLAMLCSTLAFSCVQMYFFWFMKNLQQEYTLLYGSLATLPIFLLWIYLSVMILLFFGQLIIILENKQK